MEFIIYFFFFKQKTAYEMRISDWSSDVCSSDLKVLWCRTRPDLFAPALAQAGLPPDRVIYVEAGDDKTVLACVEEGLRHGGLGAVVAEIGRLSMTASRRLQLAADGTGAIGLALRRRRRQTPATDLCQPPRPLTRRRAPALPSPPPPATGRRRPSPAVTP